MAAAVAWWRADVQCGHEGHAQSPRVCVRAWGWPLCLLPQRGWSSGAEEQRRHGAGFPSACPASSAGLRSGAPAGMEEGLLPRAWFPRPVGKPALFNDEATRQMLREVLEELRCGSRAVGQLQLLQLLQLHEAR